VQSAAFGGRTPNQKRSLNLVTLRRDAQLMPFALENFAAGISPGPMPHAACVPPDIACVAALGLGGNFNRGGRHYVCGPFQDTTLPRIATHVHAFTTGHADDKDAARQQGEKASAPRGRLTIGHRITSKSVQHKRQDLALITDHRYSKPDPCGCLESLRSGSEFAGAASEINFVGCTVVNRLVAALAIVEARNWRPSVERSPRRQA
jgi:hypothetical protein